MTANQVRVNTFSFQFAHGVAPRGKGNWGFAVNTDDCGAFFFNGTFAAARKAACKWAAARDARSIDVLS